MLATHQMDQLPLLFNFQDLVAGKDFIAGVATRGRVLMKEEDGQIWMCGVEPGGIAASGSNREAALQDFRNGFRHVLIEMAAEATSFESFNQFVQQFFREVDRAELAEWSAAHAAVRRSGQPDEGFNCVSFEENQLGLEVILLQASVVGPDRNPHEEFSKAA